MTDFLNYTVDKTAKRGKKTKRRPGFRLKKRTKKSLKMLGLIVLGVFVLLGVLAGLNYGNAMNAYEKALAGKESFLEAQSALELQDFSGAEQHLKDANLEFSDARDSLGSLWMLHFFPFAGRQYSAGKHLLDAGIYASQGAADLAHIGVQIGDRIGGGESFSFGEVTPESKEIILDEIYNSPPVLESAIENFDIAIDNVNKIPESGVLSQISDATKIFNDTLPPTTEMMKEFLPLATALPQMAGYPEEQHYLLLFLNNTELRPGGGFIGTYGELNVKSGDIQSLNTDDTYNLDRKAIDTVNVDPPWPMQRFLGSTQWFLRDANWSPDYETSSKQAMEFYQLENGPLTPLHGVIGLTPDFIASLLGLTGPIESHGITFTEDNFVDELEYQVEIRFAQLGIPMEERKDIIGDLSGILIDKILTLPLSEWPTLLEIFDEQVASKQVMFYFTNEELQALASDLEWTGEFVSTESDYLRVVDANLGSLKSDPGVERTITYTVSYDKELDAPIGKVDIYYVNTNDFSVFTTRYHTYTRVYVPHGTELLSYEWNEDIVETGSELDKTVISTFKTIEPREDEHLTFTYKLPDRIWEQIKDGTYTLDVQKQLGAADYDLVVNFDVNKRISEFEPREGAEQDQKNHLRFQDQLDRDKQFVITF